MSPCCWCGSAAHAIRLAHGDLELARIGDCRLIAGTAEAPALCRATQAATVVTSLDEVVALAGRRGGEVIDGPNQAPQIATWPSAVRAARSSSAWSSMPPPGPDGGGRSAPWDRVGSAA
ncbi:hypothetical protein ACFZB9_30740 [Kitasatospora sp. NPDC008050]|uniref:hypothetical protein n=1 Tax=Kitasatospora sp. NPDC008050 TaxID=3364021 RepID=UPI0036E51B0A